MSRRTIATIIGALVLMCLPFMGEEWMAVARAFGGLFIVVIGAIYGLAKIPPKYPIGLLRLALLPLGWLLLNKAMIEANVPATVPELTVMATAIIACLFLAAGPLCPLKFRRWLYGSLLFASWAQFFPLLYQFGSDIHASLGGLIGPLIGLGYATRIYIRWRRNGDSLFMDTLNHWGHEARSVIAAFDSPSPVLRVIRDRTQRWGFAARMILPGGPVMTHRAYSRILKTCRLYPDTALSWQIAYAAAIVKGDYEGASKLALDAQVRGFGDVLSDRTVAFALHASYDPTWRSVLAKGWQKESEQPTLWTKEAYFALDGDPTAMWRESDPAFARLQHKLWVVPKPIETPIVRSRPVTG